MVLLEVVQVLLKNLPPLLNHQRLLGGLLRVDDVADFRQLDPGQDPLEGGMQVAEGLVFPVDRPLLVTPLELQHILSKGLAFGLFD